jgi:hypothetical protein
MVRSFRARQQLTVKRLRQPYRTRPKYRLGAVAFSSSRLWLEWMIAARAGGEATAFSKGE